MQGDLQNFHQPQPLLHKNGLQPSPQTPQPSPGQGLKKLFAETAKKFWVLVWLAKPVPYGRAMVFYTSPPTPPLEGKGWLRTEE